MNLQELLEQHVPDGLSVHDLEGRYLWVSDAFAELVGAAAESLVGRDAYELVHPEDVGAIEEAHELLLRSHRGVARYRLLAHDGSPVWVESLSRFVEADQVIVLATRRILADSGSALDALAAQRQLAKGLREVDRERRTFLTAVAHRARHPITVVRGVAEVLRTHWRDLDPGAADDLLRRLTDNAERLGELIERVTDAEQLGRRARTITPRPVDLWRRVTQQVSLVERSGRPVEVDVPRGSVAFADQRLLDIAIRALLDNTVKHTPPETPVWVRWRRHPEGTLLVVEDAGGGLDPAARERAFAAFASVDDEAHDPGLGLGLHTVAEIAAVHEGRAWVEDREGGGAAFHLFLPAKASITVGTVEPTEGPDVHTSTVLVVDDDPSVCRLLAVSLRAEGYNVGTASDGPSALAAVAEHLPDLVIIDALLPGLDGREVTARLRAEPATQSVPVIICSALDDEEDRRKAHAAGADSFLGKPFELDTLLQTVAALLGDLAAISR